MRLVSFHRPISPIADALPAAAGSRRRGMVVAVLLALSLGATLAGPGPASGEGRQAVEPSAVGEGIAALERDLAEADSPEAATPIRKRLVRARMVSGSTTADLLTARAAVAERQGDGGLALDLLDAAIVVAPNWAGGRHLRGAIHAARGEFAAAVIDLGEALARDPADAATMILLAFLRERAGEKAAALDLLKRAAAADPHLPDLAAPIERLRLEVEGRPI